MFKKCYITWQRENKRVLPFTNISSSAITASVSFCPTLNYCIVRRKHKLVQRVSVYGACGQYIIIIYRGTYVLLKPIYPANCQSLPLFVNNTHARSLNQRYITVYL